MVQQFFESPRAVVVKIRCGIFDPPQGWDLKKVAIVRIARNETPAQIGCYDDSYGTVRSGEFKGLVGVWVAGFENQVVVGVKGFGERTELKTRAGKVEVAARANNEIKFARSIEHGTAVAHAALPVGIKELPAAAFGRRVALRQFRRRPTIGELFHLA